MDWYNVRHEISQWRGYKTHAIIPIADQIHSRADGAWLIDLECAGQFKGLPTGG